MMEDVLILTNTVDKRCSRCGQTLPIGRFYRKKASVDGFQAWCCDCQRDYKETRSAESRIKEMRLGDVKVSGILSSAKGLSGKDRTDLANMLNKLAIKIKKI